MAHHDLAGPGQGVVMVILQPEAGDVDDDVGTGHVVDHPAGAFQIDPYLLDPLGGRDVHGGNGGFADHAVGLHVMSGLEGFDRGDDVVVVPV